MPLKNSSTTLLFLFIFLLASYGEASVHQRALHLLTSREMTLTGSKEKIRVYFAFKEKDQIQGLSDLTPTEFSDNEAIFFFFTTKSLKQFWMPRTHFNLDIFFLDEKLRVLAIERDVKHHDSSDESKTPIPTTKTYLSQHVLEMKSSSPLAKKINIGTQLRVDIP